MKKLLAFPLIFAALLLCSCGGKNNGSGVSQPENNPGPVYQKITAEKARQMMEESADYILLDVRRLEEFKEKRIAGAVLIPVDELGSRAQAELPDKEAVILVYCQGGRRSANAANELVKMGYVNVYDFGGISDWPYETVSD